MPALIEDLKNGPNDYDTGDGIIPYRSQIGKTLGKIGDVSAITPLIEQLSVCQPVMGNDSNQKVGVDHAGIVYGLLAFGERGSAAQSVVEELYEQRKSDRSYWDDSKDALATAIDFYQYSPRQKQDFLDVSLELYMKK